MSATKLRVYYYAPVLIAVLRLIVTAIILAINPQNMSLRFFQVIPIGVLLATIFMYMKLYSDGDPVVSLLMPTIIQVICIFVFKKQVEIVPFIVPVFLDAVFLVVKGIKASCYPFEIEGEEDEDDFQDFSD